MTHQEVHQWLMTAQAPFVNKIAEIRARSLPDISYNVTQDELNVTYSNSIEEQVFTHNIALLSEMAMTLLDPEPIKYENQ